MNYFLNVESMLIGMNNKARTQGGEAWDNAKSKNRDKHVPRGKVYARFERMHRTAWWRGLKSDLDASFAALGYDSVEV